LIPQANGGRLVLVDAGANVDCKPEMYVTFALLGVAYSRVLGVARPRVGLLSNGSEASKGDDRVRAALVLLSELPVDFVGPIEPTAAMDGACDVLVCDGFVGNVLLKAAEGAVSVVSQLLREEIRRRPSGLLGAWLLSGALRRFRSRVAWDAQGGALLLGVNGVVVVGHGRSKARAVVAAVSMARLAVEGNLERHMAAALPSFAVHNP